MEKDFFSLRSFSNHSDVAVRALRAVAVAAATCGVQILVLRVGILAELPAYPAVSLTFLVGIVLPGLILQRALLAPDGLDPLVRLVIALPLGLAVAAPPGLIGLRLNLDLQAFVMLHVTLAAVVSGIATLFWREPRGKQGDHVRATLSSAVPLAVLLAIALGGIVTAPLWGGDDVSTDFDSWAYLAYVNQYMTGDPMTPLEPVGIGETGYARMLFNSWLVVQAMVADAAQVQPNDVLQSHLPAVLVVFAIGATYSLAVTIFRSKTLAIMAAAIQLGYAFLDLSPHEGFGRLLLLRMGEDKVVATFVLSPLALLVAARLFERFDPRLYATSWLIALALFSLHPVPLATLVIVLGCVAIVRAAVQRSPQPLRVGGLLVLPLAIFAVAHFVQWQLHVSDMLFSGPMEYRRAFRYVELPAGLITANYHLLLHPLMLGAIVSAPLVWWWGRHQVANQLVLAATLAALVSQFVPPLSTLLFKFMGPATLWRFHWVIPVSLTLAVVGHEAIGGLGKRVWGNSAAGRPLAVRGLRLFAPTVTVLVLLAGALWVQESYVLLDGGAFYDRTSTSSLVRWADKSIFVGGIHRAFAGEWRIRPHQATLIGFLDENLPEGSVVLAPLRSISHYIPGTSRMVKPVHFQPFQSMKERQDFVEDFYRGTVDGVLLDRQLERHEVDYVVVRRGSQQDATLESLKTTRHFADVSAYRIYEVDRG